MTHLLLDFSAAFVSPQAMRDGFFDGAILYMSDRRPGAEWMRAKPATREYCDSLRSAGLEVVSNYQFGKGDTADWRGGYDAGVHHARIASGYHLACGGPADRPIYAPIDDNPTLDEWNSMAAPFLRGWASVVGIERTGVYCNARCIDWAIEDGVARWFWQHNWSGDASINGDHPEAHIHQIEIDKRKVDDIGVDVNISLKHDYGQWSKTVAERNEIVKPEYTELIRLGDSCSSRHGARIVNFLLHTQEGNGTAESLANYLNNPANGVSYHFTLRDGVLVAVVDTDMASWSVLSANPFTINLCFAGSRAAWSREEWLNIRGDIEIAAWVAVQEARKYGFIPRVIAPPYEQGEGISDHNYVTECLGIGSHTDVGPNFPWDVFAEAVARYSGATYTATSGELDMGFLDEKIVNWQGEERTVRDIFKYVDWYNGLMLDQFVGPRSREQNGEPTRWDMLGGKTLVEALAAIGEKLGLEGFGQKNATISAPIANAGAKGEEIK